MKNQSKDSAEVELSSFDEVLRDVQAGKAVIIIDDKNRENEGDIVIAAECVTAEHLSFMMREARGLICVSLSQAVAERLELPLQAINNASQFGTPFTVNVDHHSVADKGVSASARATTIKALIDPKSAANDFVTPGHVFPLVAHPAGVLGRKGQTEGSFDLARLAGFNSSGVICEILADDGTMARGAVLNEFAKKHALTVTSVAEITRYRLEQEVRVRLLRQSEEETDFGNFSVSVFKDDVDGKEHLALSLGDLQNANVAPLVRVHSECLTGDVFGSQRCDCGAQLSDALQQIRASGCGALLYLRQEGRGIGLTNKLKAYELQDSGLDTVEANVHLGFAPDQRDFVVAARILESLGLRRIRLITNNPEKIAVLERSGIEVVERVKSIVKVSADAASYVQVKRAKLGHLAG